MDDPLAVRDKAVSEALAVYDKALAEIEASKELPQTFLKIVWLLNPVAMTRHWFKGDLDSLHEKIESDCQKARAEAWAVLEKVRYEAWAVYEKNKDK